MMTAVDTSVLLDVLLADPTFGPASAAALRDALHKGRVVACEAVWAETAAAFEDGDSATRALARLGIVFDAVDEAAALDAGAVHREYRANGGKRDRVAADFLVGAHAQARAEALLTRDRGFYRKYFAGLKVVDPAGDHDQ
jgi:predicted nucleic acid-binding protein